MSEQNARLWSATSEEYHAAHDVYGRSMLDTFRDSPMLFHGRFVTGEIAQRPRTPALIFGSNFDRFLLDCESVVEIPASALNGAGHKKGKQWTNWRDEHAGQLILKTAEYDIFQRMADNIRSHKDASQLIQGVPQKSIRWEDEQTGLALKVRPDVMGERRLVDLKTSADPTPRAFAESIEDFGYHRQAAMYSHAVELLTGRSQSWFFVVIRSATPWDVYTYTLGKDKRGEPWIDRGMREIRKAIDNLATAIKTDHWLPAGYGETLSLSPPRYTEYDDEYAIDANA